MDVIFDNNSRPAIPNAVGALQRLQDDPEQLERERARRYEDSPPPYPESGETTQPPSPGPADSPPKDAYALWWQRMEAYDASTPLNQFKAQAKRERERLEHQALNRHLGRPQTLPHDDSFELPTNAENNIRTRWIEQGIWGDNWGPAWPKESRLMDPSWWSDTCAGPFSGPHKPGASNGYSGSCWAHEETDDDLDWESEEEQESEPDPDTPRPLFGPQALPPKPPLKEPRGPRPLGYAKTQEGKQLKDHPFYRPTVAKPEASRPYHQFLYQLSKEREWVRDELLYKQRGQHIYDLDDRAYRSLRNNWIKDEIWNNKWDELPGMKWRHEEYDEDDDERADEQTGPSNGESRPGQPANGAISPDAQDYAAVEDNAAIGSPQIEPTTQLVQNTRRGWPQNTSNEQPTTGRQTTQGTSAPVPESDATPTAPASSKRRLSSDTAVSEDEPSRSAKRTKRGTKLSTSATAPRRSTRLREKQAALQKPTAPVANTTRTRGRPSKLSAEGNAPTRAPTTAAPIPRGRGRPPKAIAAAGLPRKTPTATAPAPHKRGRGRPRKSA
ncbi:unnamed protein product [Clonostachys rosea]|uniref:Uncharacterized protein n=1 Tax=Bionectria ochroleuca TaxID=29856 RepID=A0ABY6USC3_BIOOC|nr:unnamed protein product [Clonostachys rosea]